MAKNPMSCGTECARISLITLNIIFLLCGIAFFILGLVFRFGGNELKDDIKPAFENIVIKDYDLYGLIDSLAILFIVLGAIVIIFAVLGFIGAVCYVKAALVIYAILLAICLAIELAGVVLFFIMRTEFEDAAKIGMKDSINKANGIKDTTVGTQEEYHKATVYLFKEFECCHVDNVRLINGTDTNCNTSADKYGKDCYIAVRDWIKTYQGAFIGIGISVMVIELLLIVCSCHVCRSISKKETIA